jgi:hypothetical protein
MEKIMEYRVVVTKDFTKWYKHGTDLLHREDGPACEYANGDKEWYKGGKLHREDGPAIEYADGNKSWYLEGKKYSESDFLSLTKVESCEGKVVEIDGKKYKLTSLK